MNMTVIPEEQRFGNLRQVLEACVAAVIIAKQRRVDLLAAGPKDTLWALTLPWLLEIDVPAPSSELRNIIETRKAAIQAAGFNGQNIARELRLVRESDLHLAQCCPTTLHLARHFASNFVHDAASLREQGSDESAVDSLYEEFVRLTYEQGPFRRASFTHVFNLEIDGRDLKLPNTWIIRLNPDFKADLLRADTSNSFVHPFLHPPNVGDCFIYCNEGAGNKNDDAWLLEQREEASRFVMLLQYFKDGLVHTGYTVPQFYPKWAHEIRYDSLYFIGETRRQPHAQGQSLYRIEPSDVSALSRYWTALSTPAISSLINDRSSKLRQAILRAGDYFEKSHEAKDLPERLVYLAIAFEALFSPENQEQLRFRIAHAAAQFLGLDSESRKSIFEDAYEFYGRRNKLVHGGYSVDSYYDGTFVKREEIERWSSLVRRAVLGFFVLALRGETDRREILRRLEQAAFDDTVAEKIHRRARIDDYLTESGL